MDNAPDLSSHSLTPWARAALAGLRAAFEPERDPARATAMRAYMRDQFPFLGIPKPRRELLAKGALAEMAKPTQADLLSLALAAWQEEEREYAYVAQALLRRHVRRLDEDALPVLRSLLTARPWWDTVDELAQNVLGPLVARHPELVAVMERWITSEELWLRRAALLHQNTYKGKTDAARLFRHCALLARDRDFFMRKGIGWALRNYAATDPAAVRAFVDAHPELSPLSRREAMRGVVRAERGGKDSETDEASDETSESSAQ